MYVLDCGRGPGFKSWQRHVLFFENGELSGAILFAPTRDNKFHRKVVYFNQLSGAQRTRISYHDRMPVCYLDCPLFKWHLNNGHLFPIVKMLD